VKTVLAKTAGFCYGVSRAVAICEREAGGGAVMLGPVIHNNTVVGRLCALGMSVVGDARAIPFGARVVIRSHGAGKSEYALLRERGAEIIDATCPYVSRIHGIVREESASGRTPVIIGKRAHPEVAAIADWCGRCVILQSPEEMADWLAERPENRHAAISVVFQTTSSRETFSRCEQILKKECTNHKIFDTICVATYERQREASELAEKADAMIVIGGRGSANSCGLAEICAAHCARVTFIETADELDTSAFVGCGTVGITAGASTPARNIKEVIQKMSEETRPSGIPETPEVPPAERDTGGESAEGAGEELLRDAAVEPAPDDAEPDSELPAYDIDSGDPSEDAFKEMIVKTIKTLHTGDRVTGTIASITPTEVTVDLGIKQSGYIPIAEMADPAGEDTEREAPRAGDEIEAFVVRVNDVEGTVMLSKKRLNAINNWNSIEAARDNGGIVEGTVVEENTGGVVVTVKGIHVFVPASLTGVPRGTPLSTIMHSKVRLMVTETDKRRKRVIGSMKAVERVERRQRAVKLWDELETGQKYMGTVRSMTSFGAFVDIGGADGLVHVSEISWKRIKAPSDVLAVGDEIEVSVISVDKEKKKISLRYRKEEDNPWGQINENYSVGDVINVKIVRLLDFGAFAEITEDVDGLIHVSQIADHRVESPKRELSIGQMVDVKIIDIDNERQRVSLSIRALLEPEEPQYDGGTDGGGYEEGDVIVYDTDAPPAADGAAETERGEEPGETADV
jgi:4-hydroxy-3-methylbut-2-enyl diphosphate reductase